MLLKFSAPFQRRIITMDPNLYKAAMEGNLDALIKRYGDKSAEQFALQVTPNNNTVLHVAVEFGHGDCVKEILSKCPSLVSRVNDDGDTPLHIAFTGFGNLKKIIKLLIDPAKIEGGDAAVVREMSRARNHDGDTPLHLATRRWYYLELFLGCMLKDENPGLDHGPNKAGETPLYLYVERGYDEEVLSWLLKTCTPSQYGGPRGRTALHAAVIGSKVEFIDILIGWNKDLIKERDTKGWTPLHYAAENGDVEAVKKLLDKDESVAYVTSNKDEGNIALHLATAKGEIEVMKALLSRCPDCWEMVNSKGRNILHIYADSEKDEATQYISEQPWLPRLVNRKDHDGNTPMHLLAQKRKPSWILSTRSILIPADMMAVNNEDLTPYDILLPKVRRKKYTLLQKKFLRGLVEKDQGGKEKTNNGEQKGGYKNANPNADDDKGKKAEEKGKEFETLLATLIREKEKQEAAVDMGRIAETHMIVATLISTISFAAGFTIPGGYHDDQGPNQGLAVLVREAAFKAFVITNTIALICSTSSVFLYVSASLFNITGHEGERRARRYEFAFWLVIIAMLAMMLAFSTGAYAVLAHSLGLAIATCAIACSPFIVYAFELGRHFADETEFVMDTLSAIWKRLHYYAWKVRRLFH